MEEATLDFAEELEVLFYEGVPIWKKCDGAHLSSPLRCFAAPLTSVPHHVFSTPLHGLGS